eukprot:gene42212-60447_t
MPAPKEDPPPAGEAPPKKKKYPQLAWDDVVTLPLEGGGEVSVMHRTAGEPGTPRATISEDTVTLRGRGPAPAVFAVLSSVLGGGATYPPVTGQWVRFSIPTPCPLATPARRSCSRFPVLTAALCVAVAAGGAARDEEGVLVTEWGSTVWAGLFLP